jgi:FtsZ-binding cell division protein ZapB
MKMQFIDLQQTKVVLQAELTSLQTRLDELKAKAEQAVLKCEELMVRTVLFSALWSLFNVFLQSELEKQATKRATVFNSQKHFQTKREAEERKLAQLKTTAKAVCETFKVCVFCS